MFTPRQYQQDAVDALFVYFEEHSGNPILVLPTASGKSLIQAEFIKQAIELYPKTRFLCLSHVKELLEQNTEKLKCQAPSLDIGLYSAGLKRHDTDNQVIVAGIQSVYKKAHKFGCIDIVMIDECHLLSPVTTTRYQKFITDLKIFNPKLKIVGMSATPYRMNHGLLTDGKGALFTHIAYDCDLKELIGLGFLCPLSSVSTVRQADTSGVRLSGGEYIQKDLAKTMNNDELTEAALDEAFKHIGNRHSVLVFCTGIDHTIRVRDKIRARGFDCEAVTGKTPATERANTLQRFKTKQLRFVTNANVWTTGMDAPNVDCIIVLRPTKSPGLHVQMLGRGMRIHPDKNDCLVLDFTDNILVHGPVDQITIRRKYTSDGFKNVVTMAPQRKCPECNNLVSIGVRRCPVCDFEFVGAEYELKHRTMPTAASPLSDRSIDEPRWLYVDYWHFNRHIKIGRPDSLRIDYYVKPGPDSDKSTHCISEWLCFDHPGYARSSARIKWKSRFSDVVPETVTDAIELFSEIKMPIRILVKKSDRFYVVIDSELQQH